MSVKRGNLRADTVVKNYWRSNEQFADFFNAVLFDGEQVIKPDELIPVITIVVYYGEKSWDGAASLHEMLNIPKTMESFVNDYKMHLVEARKNDLNCIILIIRIYSICLKSYWTRAQNGM